MSECTRSVRRTYENNNVNYPRCTNNTNLCIKTYKEHEPANAKQQHQTGDRSLKRRMKMQIKGVEMEAKANGSSRVQSRWTWSKQGRLESIWRSLQMFLLQFCHHTSFEDKLQKLQWIPVMCIHIMIKTINSSLEHGLHKVNHIIYVFIFYYIITTILMLMLKVHYGHNLKYLLWLDYSSTISVFNLINTWKYIYYYI